MQGRRCAAKRLHEGGFVPCKASLLLRISEPETVTAPLVAVAAGRLSDRNHGVARYVQMIAKSLADRPRLEYEPVFLCRKGMEQKFSGFETIEVSTPHLDPKEVLTIPWVLIRSRAKLFHSTNLSSFAGLHCPSILTIHDLVHLQFGSPFGR